MPLTGQVLAMKKNTLYRKKIEAAIFASQLYAVDIQDFVRFKDLQRPAILMFVK